MLRLKMFENRVLRRIFGPKREEVAGCWRRLHIEDLHNLYSSSNIRVIKYMIRHAVYVPCMGVVRNTYRTIYKM
jgi:hypothetical protein